MVVLMENYYWLRELKTPEKIFLCAIAMAPMGGLAIGGVIHGVHNEPPQRQLEISAPQPGSQLRCLGSHALRVSGQEGEKPIIIQVDHCSQMDPRP
jgi:hypothetical protein